MGAFIEQPEVIGGHLEAVWRPFGGCLEAKEAYRGPLAACLGCLTKFQRSTLTFETIHGYSWPPQPPWPPQPLPTACPLALQGHCPLVVKPVLN